MKLTKDGWFPSRLSFGKFKGKLYQEAREDAELRSWVEWQGSAASPQAACQRKAKAGCQGGPGGPRLVKIGLYQRLVESALNRLAELELEYGIEKSKVDSIRSKLFGTLRESYQERDRL